MRAPLRGGPHPSHWWEETAALFHAVELVLSEQLAFKVPPLVLCLSHGATPGSAPYRYGPASHSPTEAPRGGSGAKAVPAMTQPILIPGTVPGKAQATCLGIAS
jgi:hypothetical protein